MTSKTETNTPDRHRWGIPKTLRGLRGFALTLITAVVVLATTVAFIESYEGLYRWALHHGLSGGWAQVWPLQVDAFIAVGELALFIAIVDRWESHRFPALVTTAGLAFSVWGNVGHVTDASLAFKATGAVPPLAAAAGLMVGLQVLKRIVAARTSDAEHESADKKEREPVKPTSDGPKVKTGRTASRRTVTAPPDVDDLMPLGWRIVSDLETRGEPLTRERLRAAIRETGQPISTDRARVLLARLKTEAPADPVEPPQAAVEVSTE